MYFSEGADHGPPQAEAWGRQQIAIQSRSKSAYGGLPKQSPLKPESAEGGLESRPTLRSSPAPGFSPGRPRKLIMFPLAFRAKRRIIRSE